MGNFAKANGAALEGSAPRHDNDFYPTPPWVTYSLLMSCNVPNSIWEPAAGRGWMARELARCGKAVIPSDLHAYPNPLVSVATGVDFLTAPRQPVDAIVTNPPYGDKLALAFAKRGLEHGVNFMALLCRFNFAESRDRYPFFASAPPSEVHVFSRRFSCSEEYFGKNTGRYDKETETVIPGPDGWENKVEAFDNPFAGMVAFAWWVWRREATPHPAHLHWINSDAMYESWKLSMAQRSYAVS